MANNVNSHICSVVDEDGAVILDFESNSIVRLNSTGGFIWERLKAGSSLQEIVLVLARETKAEIEDVERDVREFLEDLKSKHLTDSRIGGSDAV
jgi:hypothetical protein